MTSRVNSSESASEASSAGDLGLQARLLVQPDFEVGQQHEFGPRLGPLEERLIVA
jgi:hypothetical protein